MPLQHHRVCVVGFGIMGATSAYVIAQKFPHSNITIIADSFEEFSESKSSDHGFGIIGLYQISQNDNPQILEWTKQTASYINDVMRNQPKQARGMGITEVKGFSLIENKKIDSLVFRETVKGFREATTDEITNMGLTTSSHGVQILVGSGVTTDDITWFTYKTFIIDATKYIKWIKLELLAMTERSTLNVKFLKQKLTSPHDVINHDYDVIVNCAGLGAEIIAEDNLVYPIRGQYIETHCDEVGDVIFDANMGQTTILRKGDKVILGCSNQHHVRTRQVDPRQTADILRRTEAIFSAIKNSNFRCTKVGVRPCRKGGARLEMIKPEIPGSNPAVVHCYGHGGKGIMQHWRCAQNVLKLICDIFEKPLNVRR